MAIFGLGRRARATAPRAGVSRSCVVIVGLAMIAPVAPMFIWLDAGDARTVVDEPRPVAALVAVPSRVNVVPIETKPPPPPKIVRPCPTVLDGAQPPVAMVGNALRALFAVSSVGAAGGRGGSGDHGDGLALDLMINSTEVGTALANFVLANRERFGATYVIWQQRYNDGGGWSTMEDRGSPTANHMDHVHVSFRSGARVNVTC